MTTTTQDTPAPDGEGKVLRIVAGLHAGASRTLADREMILIGSGDDCDIVLADKGVASHHALISVVDGVVQLRALDAPVKLEGRVLHPGDPIELPQVERIGLGDAALAFGAVDDPAWLALAPEGTDFDAPASRPGQAFTRRLPMIAAVSVLSLALLAIFVAVVPAQEQAPDVGDRLRELAQEYNVANPRVQQDTAQQYVLTGTVADRDARDALRQRLQQDGLQARVDLRSGDDLAYSVSEMFRGGNFRIDQVRYLGNDDVEVTGHFPDEAEFEAFARSRAVRETGVRRIVPINLAGPAAGAETPAAALDPLHVVAVVRGDNAHVVAIDGTRYEVGAELPGLGQLVSIGEHAQVLRGDGSLQRLTPRPPPTDAAAAADDGADSPDSAQQQANASRQAAREAQQARAAGRRM